MVRLEDLFGCKAIIRIAFVLPPHLPVADTITFFEYLNISANLFELDLIAELQSTVGTKKPSSHQ